MKKLILFLFLLNISCAHRIAIQRPTLYQDQWHQGKITVPSSRMEDFVGEKYLYKVSWLGFTVGRIEFRNLGIEKYKGFACYHIVARAWTNIILKHIFRVQDEFDSYIEVKGLKPIAFISKRREGGYKANSETFFDYKRKKVVEHSFLNNSTKEVDLKKGLYDPLSCFYKLRTLPLKSNKYVISLINRSTIWNVEIGIMRRGMLEIRRHGVLKAFLASIKAARGKEKARGRAWVWVSADPKKALLLAQINVNIPIVGTVVVALE